jgi:hypothetical protein
MLAVRRSAATCRRRARPRANLSPTACKATSGRSSRRPPIGGDAKRAVVGVLPEHGLLRRDRQLPRAGLVKAPWSSHISGSPTP